MIAMKILSREPSGVVVLNPPNIVAFAAQSKHNAAAIVVSGDDLIASTSILGCHNTMMEMAGIELRNFALADGNPKECSLRGGIHNGNVNIDIWNKDGKPEDVEAHVENLKRLLEFLTQHEGLRHASSVALTIFDDGYIESHVFTHQGLEAIALYTPSV